jgi:hypothetical protein
MMTTMMKTIAVDVTLRPRQHLRGDITNTYGHVRVGCFRCLNSNSKGYEHLAITTQALVQGYAIAPRTDPNCRTTKFAKGEADDRRSFQDSIIPHYEADLRLISYHSGV